MSFDLPNNGSGIATGQVSMEVLLCLELSRWTELFS
jgi:hypothetical protein